MCTYNTDLLSGDDRVSCRKPNQ